MIIAQGSVSIDENAKLANEASQHSDDNKRQMESLLGGKITQSTLDPRTFDTGTHQEGDMWIQIDSTSDGKQLPTAKAMFYYTNGAWVPKKWDSQSLAVKQLSALTADLGVINNGTINSVAMNGVEINVDFDGYGTGSYDGGHNSLSWSTDGMFQPDNGPTFVDDAYLGFHFKHGLMSWKARRTGSSNNDGIGSYDSTYIGPNDIKVRNTDGTQAAAINNRVDIRSNYLEVASGWGTPTIGSFGCTFSSNGDGVVGQTLQTSRLVTNIINPTFNGGFWTASGSGGLGGDFSSGGSIGANVAVSAPKLFGQLQNSSSDLSKKDHIESFDDKSALSEVMGTDIYKYKYNGDNENLHVGPIIDDINDTKDAHYNMSEYLITRDEKMGNSFKLKNGIGLLFGAVHELTRQNEKLLARITLLEMKQNGNNK